MAVMQNTFIFMMIVCLNYPAMCVIKPYYDLTVIRNLDGDYWNVRNKTECMFYYRALADGNTCTCPKSHPNFYLKDRIYGCYKDDEIMPECRTPMVIVNRNKEDAFIKKTIFQVNETIKKCELIKPLSDIHVWDGEKWSKLSTMDRILSDFDHSHRSIGSILFHAEQSYFKSHNYKDMIMIGKYRWIVGRLVRVKVMCQIRNTHHGSTSMEVCSLAKAVGTEIYHIRNISMPTQTPTTMSTTTTKTTTTTTTTSPPPPTTTTSTTSLTTTTTTTTTIKTTITPPTTTATTSTAKPTSSPSSPATTTNPPKETYLTLLKINETASSNNKMPVDTSSSATSLNTKLSTTAETTTRTTTTEGKTVFKVVANTPKLTTATTMMSNAAKTTEKSTTLSTTTSPSTTTKTATTVKAVRQPSTEEPISKTLPITRKTTTKPTIKRTATATKQMPTRNLPFSPSTVYNSMEHNMFMNKNRPNKEPQEHQENEKEFNVIMIAIAIGLTTFFLILIMVAVVLCQKYKQRHQCSANSTKVTTVRKTEVHANQYNSVKEAIASESIYAELDLRQVPPENSYCTLEKIQSSVQTYQQQQQLNQQQQQQQQQQQFQANSPHKILNGNFSDDPVYMETEPYAEDEETYSEIPYQMVSDYFQTHPGVLNYQS